MNLDHIILEAEQIELLNRIVEASRKVPSEKRRKISLVQKLKGDFLSHAGFNGKFKTYLGDVQALAKENLLNLEKQAQNHFIFDVTPLGFRYYEYVKGETDSSAEEIETNVQRYIDSNSFRGKHAKAYKKWHEAQRVLWSHGVESELTTIGHICRECMQEFAESLLRLHNPESSLTDKTKTVQRIRDVISKRKKVVGETRTAFLDALLPLWGTVNDMVQRQEHGAQMESQNLSWEDARLIVFQTLIVMYEIDRAFDSA